MAVDHVHDEDSAAAVVERITASGGTAQAFQADVARSADAERLVREVRGAFGPVDVLVGDVLTTREFVEQDDISGGAIVDVTSVGVVFTAPQTALCTATKAALVGLTRVLSLELAPRGIRVNAIAAGLVDTEGTRASGFIGSDAEAAVVAQIPLGRLGAPQEIGSVAVFLASDASRFVTGDVICASGGQV